LWSAFEVDERKVTLPLWKKGTRCECTDIYDCAIDAARWQWQAGKGGVNIVPGFLLAYLYEH
jgi:hypothetical protein